MNDQASAPNGNPRGQLIPAAQTLPMTFDPYGPLAPYGGSEVNAPELVGRKLFEIWRILIKRKWLILSIVAACVALNGVRTLMQTPVYTATVRMQIDPVSNLVSRDDNNEEEDNFMATQDLIIRSHLMAERVAAALKLGQDVNFFRPRSVSVLSAVKGMFSKAPSAGDEGAAARQSKASDIVQGNVATNPIQNTRMIDISYSDPDPARAQRIANAYADAFVATTIDKRFQANASAKVFLDDKVQQLKLRLEESEKKLLAFAQQQQIVASEGLERASIAETNLASANTELQTLTSERTKNEQLWRQLEGANAISLPQLLSNSVIENLRSQRKALVLDYEDKSQTFKAGYPVMVQINAKIKEIDKQLADEVQTIRDSLKAGYEASLARENELKERIQVLKQDVLDLQNRSIQYNILKREVDTNRELYASLLQRYKEADVAGGVGTNNIFVVDKAGLPGAPSSPNLSHALVLALMLGVAAGCAAAYGLEFLDDKVRAVEQVESMGLSVLGVIPNCDNLAGDLADPRSAVAEAYRTLCTGLMFASENGLPNTLLITSATPSEGKSSTAISIAKHFALLDRKVLLIDADLRNPSLHTKLHRDNSMGLSNCLTGACTPPEVMQSTETPNWAFMASGPLPPNAADLLSSSRLYSLLSIGSEVFDLIVIDGPPVLGLADAQILASAAEGTVFIVGAGQVRPALIRTSLRHLQLSRASVIGAVLTKHDAKAYGYGYGYGYGDGHGYGYGYGYGQNHRSAADPRGLSVRISDLDKRPPQLTDVQGKA
jgi:capsular exopolysaccharide synthesis family protein